MDAITPVELPNLGLAFDTSSCRLIHPDMRDPVLVGGFNRVYGDSRQGNDFTNKPIEALKSKDWVQGIGEGFALRRMMIRITAALATAAVKQS